MFTYFYNITISFVKNLNICSDAKTFNILVNFNKKKRKKDSMQNHTMINVKIYIIYIILHTKNLMFGFIV